MMRIADLEVMMTQHFRNAPLDRGNEGDDDVNDFHFHADSVSRHEDKSQVESVA